MTDKVQKFRKEVERLKSNLIHGACSSQVAMENRCKEEAYNEVLAILDTMQKEPVSMWHDASEEPNHMSHCLVFFGNNDSIGHYLHYTPTLYNKHEKVFVTEEYPHPTGYKVEQKSIDGGCVAEVYKDKRDRISISDITQWCYLNDLHNFTQKEEPASGDLGEYINELSKQFPEVSFAKLSRIAVRVAKWQEKQTITDACELLRANLCEYFDASREDYDNFIDDFRKVMED